MVRSVGRLALWGLVVWVLFFVPAEGRSWARHLSELWALPAVQGKIALATRQAKAALGRLRAALPAAEAGRRRQPPGAGDHGQTAADRAGLDRLIRERQVAPAPRHDRRSQHAARGEDDDRGAGRAEASGAGP